MKNSPDILPSPLPDVTQENQKLSAERQSSTRLRGFGKPLVWLSVAAFALGQANCFRGGVFSFVAGGFLLLALVAVVVGLNALNPKKMQAALSSEEKSGVEKSSILLRLVPSLARFSVLGVGFSVLFLVLAFWQIASAGVVLNALLWQFKLPSAPALIFGVLAVFGVLWSLGSPRGWWLQLAVFVGVGWWLLAHQTTKLDVSTFQSESCAALLRGQNPYSITFANNYADNSPYWGKGISVGGRLQFGYLYMPLTLLLALPGYLLGDVRFSHMAAILISALLVAGARPRAEKALLGALFLWTPVVFFVLFLSWTDSFCVLALCFVFWCAQRCPKWLPLACGLFLISKQYGLLMIPLLWLLAPLYAQSSTRWRGLGSWAQFWGFLWKTLAVAALVTLPMALWNWKAFFYSAMVVQFKQPFRPDSLSFMALSNQLGWGIFPTWLPLVLFIAATVWALRRAPRDEVGFLVAVALTLLVFFAFNKQAFVNYYFFVMSALWCATMAVFERALAQKKADLAVVESI